jgi:hypothetical protein
MGLRCVCLWGQLPPLVFFAFSGVVIAFATITTTQNKTKTSRKEYLHRPWKSKMKKKKEKLKRTFGEKALPGEVEGEGREQ